MNLLPLLGQQLKSDTIVEILEHFSMEVVYDFDRLREGTDDRYWSEAKAQGFQFRFNKDQRLDVIFLYAAPSSGFSCADVGAMDVPTYPTLESARAEFERGGIPFKAGAGYIKALLGSHSRHYEFRDGVLSLITLSLTRG